MNIFLKLKMILKSDIIENIEKEYSDLVKSYQTFDEIKTGIHSGRICELISALLCEFELKQVQDLNNISFDKNFNSLYQHPNKDARQEITCLMIPLVLKSVYTIRNKKVAHFKINFPKKIDMKYIKMSIDWIIAQFCIIFLNIDESDIKEFLEVIGMEEFNKVERFEKGEILFLDKISLTEQILFILYEKYNEGRIPVNYLNDILKPKKKSYITTYLNNLKKKKFIHINDNGIILTKKGILNCQDLIKKLK